MAWIEQVPIESATGLLKSLFEAATRRAGRVWNILRVQSLNPRALQASTSLYTTIMMGASPLTRVQREMLATVVSAELNCHY